jgi:hypothetical protein
LRLILSSAFEIQEKINRPLRSRRKERKEREAGHSCFLSAPQRLCAKPFLFLGVEGVGGGAARRWAHP